MQRSLLLIALASLLAACGGAEPAAYKADPSATCLRKLGYRVTTADPDVGVVAAAAPNGGLRAFEPGNTVTIAFGENQDDALQIEGAFRRYQNQILHGPISALTEETRAGHQPTGHTLLDALRKLFRLQE